jgi:hypothetical protein
MDGDPAECEVAVEDALGDLQRVTGGEGLSDLAEVVTCLRMIGTGLVALAWGKSRYRGGHFAEAISKLKDAAGEFGQAEARLPPLGDVARSLRAMTRGACACAEGARSVSLGRLGEGAGHYRRGAGLFREAQAAYPAEADPEGAMRKKLLTSSEDALGMSRTLSMGEAAVRARRGGVLHGVVFLLLWLASTVGLLSASSAADLGIPWWGAAIASLVAAGVALRFLPLREAVQILRREPASPATRGTELDIAPPRTEGANDRR